MMFIGFPMDFVRTRHLDKAVAFFGQLVDWRVESALSCVIVKVMMNGDAKIPVRFLVTCGTPGNARSFTAIVVRLQEEGFRFLGDESPPPEHGFANLLPQSPQHWMAYAGGHHNVAAEALHIVESYGQAGAAEDLRVDARLVQEDAGSEATLSDHMEASQNAVMGIDQDAEIMFVPIFEVQPPFAASVVPPVGAIQAAIITVVQAQTALQMPYHLLTSWVHALLFQFQTLLQNNND